LTRFRNIEFAAWSHLGDRWYENEIYLDKDNQKTKRETWYNIEDDDIEAFKLEWTE
jgi:hypothetical protein